MKSARVLPAEALLVFCRHPEPGRVKTRLIPRLGASRAAELYERMRRHVMEVAACLDRKDLIKIACLDPPGCVPSYARNLARLGFVAIGQSDGDLGDRLAAAFWWAFSSGARRVVAIGSDCLDVTCEVLDESLEALWQADAVLGPTEDGGYYLLGMSRWLPGTFRGISWSSSRVHLETLERLTDQGATVKLLPARRDIDTWEDLQAVSSRWGFLLGLAERSDVGSS